MKRVLVLILAGLALTGCARRTQVISAYHPSDDLKTCGELTAELRGLSDRIMDAAQERDYIARRDLAVVAAPVTLGWSLSEFDLTNASEVQLDKLNTRYVTLGTIAMRRGCQVQNDVKIDAASGDARLHDRAVHPISVLPRQP